MLNLYYIFHPSWRDILPFNFFTFRTLFTFFFHYGQRNVAKLPVFFKTCFYPVQMLPVCDFKCSFKKKPVCFGFFLTISVPIRAGAPVGVIISYLKIDAAKQFSLFWVI